MSVCNLYNYFKSKEILAQDAIIYTSNYLGSKIKDVNTQDISAKEKIKKIVEVYFKIAQDKPQMIEPLANSNQANR